MMPMRWDAWVTLGLLRCAGRRMRFDGARGRIPVLMYHSVSAGPSDHRHPYFETNVSPERFAEQIRYLAAHGYRTMTMSEAVAAMAVGVPTAQPSVAITFDDGYLDFMTTAWALLSNAGMTATVFLPTALVGVPRRSMEGRLCLTWDEVRALSAAGVEFGSHTVNHPQLADLSPDEVALELAESKSVIEQEIGRPCRGFSYPYAFPAASSRFTTVLRQTLISAGYEWGVTTIVGTGSSACDRYLCPRLPVNEYDTTAMFEAKLKGAYDWVRPFQFGWKHLKQVIGFAQGHKAR